MDLKQIHSNLSAKFGDAVLPFSEPENGDAWIEIAPDRFREVAAHLKEDSELKFDFLRLISGVDWVDWVEVVYHLFSYEHRHAAVLKVKLDANNPKVATVSDVWPAADWLERETFDLVGIQFEGHPDMTRILLPEDWEGHPLRKDYQQPDEYHGISHW